MRFTSESGSDHFVRDEPRGNFAGRERERETNPNFVEREMLTYLPLSCYNADLVSLFFTTCNASSRPERNVKCSYRMDARKLFQEARRDPKAGLEGADDRREEGRQVPFPP